MMKLLHIAGQEMGYHLRQWTFYIAALGLPLVFAAVGAWPRVQAATQETPLAQVETIFNTSAALTMPTGYVDYAGIINVLPEQTTAPFLVFASEAEAKAALQQGDIESYYVIAADYLQSGAVTQYSPAPQLLADSDNAVKQLLRDNLLHRLDNPTLAARLDRPVTLVRRGPPPPAFSFIPAGLDSSRLISAGLVLALFAYMLNISGILLLRALQRETRARVLEVLIVSASPAQLIGGKIAGLATLAQAQVGLALLAGELVYSGGMMAIAAIWPNLPESISLLTGRTVTPKVVWAGVRGQV